MKRERGGRARRHFLAGALGAALAALGPACTAGARAPAAPAPTAQAQPNILVIMADDLGFSDIGAYGGNIDTPNLDALAAHSIRLANFYNMSRCCPSRASLLTGRYPHRVNMAGNGTSLSLDVPTVAEELKRGGYATSMVGKWHLTAAEPMPDPQDHLKWLNHQGFFDRDFGDKRTYPAARGFDHAWGIIWGVADYYDPFSLVDDFTPVRTVPRGFYLTSAITDHAVQQVESMAAGKKPFMMYLAYTASHWPLMAPEALIQKYIPRFGGGWDALRKQRFARQVKLGLFKSDTKLPEVTSGYAANSEIAWAELTPEQRKIQIRKMATHAAMIEMMDRGIGQVIAALRKTGQYDNTVIFFLSDNGASPEIMTQPGYDRPSETRDGRKIEYGEYPNGVGGETTMAGIGDHWASAANTPWRWWKREQYQGGTHTPFLMSWPGHMGKLEGRFVQDTAHITDVTPTILALAGVTPRTDHAPIDGVSLLPVLSGKTIQRAQPLFFEHYGARGILDGNWKMVSLAPKGPARPYLPWHLYDLSKDPTETNDLAAANPAIVKRLASEWTKRAQELGVQFYPKGNGSSAE